MGAMNNRSAHLASRVEARRRELGMTPTELADATGLSAAALLNLRNGEIRRYQERLTLPLTRVFGWSPDSIDRLLNGDEPVRVDVAADPDDVTRLRAAVESLALAVRRIALVTGVSLDDLQLLDATHDDPPDARGQP